MLFVNNTAPLSKPVSAMMLGNKPAVLLSSLEVQTDILRLPRLPRKQREKTVRREIRPRYPGNTDNADIEYLPLPRSRKERAEKIWPLAVFTAEPETGLRYREKRGSIIPGLAFLLAGQKYAGKESDLVLLVTPDWIDAAFFAGEELAEYSTIGRRGAFPPFDFIENLRAKTGMEKRGPVLIILKDTDETDDYVQNLKRHYTDNRIIGAGDFRDKINIRRYAVFHGKKTKETFPGKNVKKAAAFLPVFYGLFLFLSLTIVTAKAENNAALLKRTYDERKARHDESETLLAEITALENPGLDGMGFPDPYALIVEIHRCIRGARIHSITIQGEKFSLEAEARDALRLIRELERSSYFTGITLHQTMPSQADWEQFSVSVRIRHE
ncbi:MAG: hypothetical protein LBF77_09505 [Spirochaetaceae bacterium]|jgi:hypothetical protein|nr:hypothetical protein [Spirochaetaceae bacterium]